MASKRYRELCSKKNEIERNIKELLDLLDSQKGVGLTESLVDSEGYPRSDIDVYSCRQARHQISCLQNDHVAVMKEIEEELVKIHEEARSKNPGNSGSTGNREDGARGKAEVTNKTAFAVVDRVDPGSPAANAGLEVDDQLLEFGSVTSENFVSLQTVSSVLQHSRDKAVRIEVLRRGQVVRLSVVPTTWSGPGLLGCNIKPLK